MILIVHTEPIPKARARTVVRGGRVMSYTPKATAEAEAQIRAEIIRQCPSYSTFFDGRPPLSVKMLFVITKPPSVSKKRVYPVTRPDIDNYTKLVMDACNGYLWADDAQVCRMVAEKVYGQPPRVEIEVERMP